LRLVRVGTRPVDETIRRQIQQAGAKRWWGWKERVGRFGRKVGHLGAPDARDERQGGLGRSGRMGGKEQTGFLRTQAPYVQ